METETYQFWEMVLNAPSVIAFSGGLAVALITLVVTLLTNRHNTKAKKLEWERSEALRKEGRLFELRRKAYEEFLVSSFIPGSCIENIDFDEIYAESVKALTSIRSYGSQQSMDKAEVYFKAFWVAINEFKVRKNDDFSSLAHLYRELNQTFREDLDSFHQLNSL